MEPAVIDAFVARIEQRLVERSGDRGWALEQKREHQKEMILGSMAISIPLFAIAAAFAASRGRRGPRRPCDHRRRVDEDRRRRRSIAGQSIAGSSRTKQPPGPGPSVTSPPHERASACERETEPGSFVVAATDTRFEHALAELARNPGPVVADGDASPPVRRARDQLDALAGMAAGVLDQRGERATDHIRFALTPRQARGHLDGDIVDLPGDRGQVDRLRGGVGLAARDREQCVDRSREPVDLGDDDLSARTRSVSPSGPARSDSSARARMRAIGVRSSWATSAAKRC